MIKQEKVLLVGAFSHNPMVYTYASSFVTALQELNFDVEIFNYRTPLLWKKNTWINDIIINKMLIAKTIRFAPSLIFLIKAESITASTLAFLQSHIRCKMINFYPDNPFVLWNGNSKAEVLKSLPLYTCFLSWSRILNSALESAGCNHVCSFPFAYDKNLFSSSAHHTPYYVRDLCFIGTWEPEREQWLTHIATHLPSINLAIWGNEWHKHCKNQQLKKYIHGPAIYNQEMITAFQTSKIVLNFIRKQNITSHNMRTFEVPASNAFLLTQRTVDQAEFFFKEGESVACFSTPEELIQKIRFYLNHEDKRLHLQRNGFEKAQEYSLSQQLKNYFNTCPQLTTLRVEV